MTHADRRQNIRNVLALIIAQAAAAAVGFIAFVRIGSMFQVVELGRYGFAASGTALFGLLAELGMRYIAIKEIAIDKTVSRRVLRHSVVLRILLSVATVVLLAAVSELYPPWKNETRLLCLAGLVAVTQFGADPISWVMFGHGRVDIGSAVLVIDRILYVLAINIAAMVFRSAESLFIASLIANMARSLIAWIRLRPMIRDLPRDHEWNPALFKRMIVNGLALGVAIMVSVGYLQATTVVAQSVTTPAQLGYYAVAIGLVNIFLIVPMALTNALFPTLAAVSHVGETHRLYRNMLHLTLVTVLPLGVAMYVLAEPLLNFWFGGQYIPAAPAVRILSIGMIASGFNYFYRILLFAQDRPWIETAIDVAALVAVVVGGSFAGARYGSVGVAAAYTIVETTVLVFKAAVMASIGGAPMPGGLFARGLISTAVPAAIVLAFPMPVRYQALLLVVVMSAMMALLDVIPMRLLWQMMNQMGQVVLRAVDRY